MTVELENLTKEQKDALLESLRLMIESDLISKLEITIKPKKTK